MRFQFLITGFTIIILFFASSFYSAEPELRSVWYTRYEWPGDNETICKNVIKNSMETLKENNFNCVLFQVRGECDTLYPSPYEPWAPQFDWEDPGWDPMAYAIEQAHNNGIKFYAYINTHTMCTTAPPDNTDPLHIYHKYGDPALSPNWQIHTSDGEPAGLLDAYFWLSPGIPEVEAWTRKQIMYVAENYDIDGLHFDRIRTPGSQFSHDPVAERRFTGDGNPDNEEWGDWMRSQITRQLRKIYGAVNEVKPHIVITAAPFGICKKEPGGYQGYGTESYYSWYQDSFGWMENHVLDAIYPMIYWEIGSAHPFEVLLSDFLNHTGGRHIYPGCHVSNDIPGQITESRNQGCAGTAIFSFDRVNFTELKGGVYSEAAAVPELPWKINPITGIIVGNVIDEMGNPVVDAKINRDGDSYNYLSSSDGFYTILDVPPGLHEISAFKNNLGTVTADTDIKAGEVVRIDLVYSGSIGVIELDKEAYLCGSVVNIVLRDKDLKGNPSVSVKAGSETEPGPLDITLEALDSNGVFGGNVKLYPGTATNDDILQVTPGGKITITYEDAFNGSGPATVNQEAIIKPHEIIHESLLDEPSGFSMEGIWEYGKPTGNGGDLGGADPTSGFTGSNVYGINLEGGYVNRIAYTQYLTTPEIDCSGGSDTTLTFHQWLSIQGTDRVMIEASSGWVPWNTVWQNPGYDLVEDSWSERIISISETADYQEDVLIRWGHGPTDDSGTYGGWNIDDIIIYQIPGGSLELIIDNDEPGFSYDGYWGVSTQGIPYGATKRFSPKGDGTSKSYWRFANFPPGKYEVYFWVNDNNYATDAHYYIGHKGNPQGEEVVVSQNFRGDGWHSLGEYEFDGSGEITVTDFWEGDGLYVVADAMKLKKAVKTTKHSLWFIY